MCCCSDLRHCNNSRRGFPTPWQEAYAHFCTHWANVGGRIIKRYWNPLNTLVNNRSSKSLLQTVQNAALCLPKASSWTGRGWPMHMSSRHCHPRSRCWVSCCFFFVQPNSQPECCHMSCSKWCKGLMGCCFLCWLSCEASLKMYRCTVAESSSERMCCVHAWQRNVT